MAESTCSFTWTNVGLKDNWSRLGSYDKATFSMLLIHDARGFEIEALREVGEDRDDSRFASAYLIQSLCFEGGIPKVRLSGEDSGTWGADWSCRFCFSSTTW